MKEDSKYPDLEPDGLGDLKEIKRLPQMKSPAPQIRWGEEYKSWPVERRLSYAERLASSMNHAADLLQTERNKLLEVVKRQEEQLKQATEKYVEQGQVMHRELGAQDAEKQQLYAQIVELTAKVKELTTHRFCASCGTKQ